MSNLLELTNMLKRFWHHVDINGPEECWEWMGATDNKGYGRFYLDGHNRRAPRAVAYLIGWLSSIDESIQVLHKCDNKGCVNPGHLYLGNHIQNVKDAVNRDRYPYRKGEANDASKLMYDDIKDIREALKYETVAGVARRYGVCWGTIKNIKTGKTWSHVQ